MDVSLQEVLLLLDKNQTKITHASKLKKPLLYRKISEFASQNNYSPIELCWLILHNTNPTECKICKQKSKFNSMKHGYFEACSKECNLILKKQRCSEKLLSSWSNNKKSILEKRAKTCFERFGVEHALQSNSIKEKGRKTCLDLYGVDHPTKVKEIQNRIIDTKRKIYKSFSLIAKKGNQKRISTCKNKFGVDNVSQSSIIKEKSKQTSQLRYGTDNYSKTLKFKEQYKQTCLLHFGVDHYFKSQIGKEKLSLSAIKRQKRGSYKSKLFTFPSGRQEKVQGYEQFAIKHLLDDGIDETDIFTTRQCPVINYNNNRYLPDIFIKSQNLLIEVKSKYTLEVNLNNTLIKHQASIDAGFKHEIWVISSKGDITQIIK